MIDISKPSVMSLLLQMRYNGQVISTGTGFITMSSKGPVLITNRHNVTGRRQDDNKLLSRTAAIPNEVVIHHNFKNNLGRWIKKVERLYSDPENEMPRWYEHPTLGPKADIVALPLSDLNGVELFPYQLSLFPNDLLLTPSDTVNVVGFPFGLTVAGCLPIWATGFIASEPFLDYDNLPIQLIDCRSRKGQSGSPVILYRNDGVITARDGGTRHYGSSLLFLIGIYSGRINDESDIGIVWKTKAIIELIQKI